MNVYDPIQQRVVDMHKRVTPENEIEIKLNDPESFAAIFECDIDDLDETEQEAGVSYFFLIARRDFYYWIHLQNLQYSK